MEIVNVAERTAGPAAALGLVGYVLAELAGLSPGTFRAERDINRLTEAASKFDERLASVERETNRLGFSIENNREFITNTAITLRDMNKALSAIEISVVKIEGRLSEIDRRTGGKGEQ